MEEFKIISWNINGLRSQKNNFKQFLDDLDAHIICFQETKITRDQLEESLALVDGYVSFFSFSRKRSGYSGVVTYCKREVTPIYAQEGLGGTLGIGSLKEDCGKFEALSSPWDMKDLKALDAEGRCVITQHPFMNENNETKLLSVINVYCPRADPDKPERALFKLGFYELLRQRASAIQRCGSFVTIVGDVNTSHKRIDHCEPGDDEDFEMRDDRVFLDGFILNTPLVTVDNQEIIKKEEAITGNNRDESTEHLESISDFKVVDTFRYFHPRQEEAFTCWNTKVNARSTNYGTRIDYILCDRDFVKYVKDSRIHPDILGSDHCPVSIIVAKVMFLSNHAVPSTCTKFYLEFSGNQQKLSTYFKANSTTSERKINSNIKEESYSKGRMHLPSSKRKLNEDKGIKNKRKIVDTKQSTLNSFFVKNCDSAYAPKFVSSESENSVTSEFSSQNSTSSHSSISSTEVSDIAEDENSLELCKQVSANTDHNQRKSVNFCNKNNSNNKWGFLMKAPEPPPLCSVHKEPSVLRTVKKKGPNFNKQFYSCARGAGKEGDPNGRCNFFLWKNNKK